MSTAPKLLEIDYYCLKTELSLSLPGSQEQSDDQVLELSLFDQQTHANANANASYSFNINTRDSTGKGGLHVLPDYSSSDMKWGLSVNAGSQSQLVIEKGASLFSHGAGTCKVVNVLEIGSGVCKKPVQLKDMDIDVVASDSDKPPPMAKKPTATDPAAKAQVIGWPPIRSFRKNSVAAAASTKNSLEADGKSGMSCLYVKVSMDGAPYLRKVDLKLYKNYKELSLALKKMFSSFTVGLVDSQLNDMHQGSSECVLTYKDKDGDWMLVGDVPWDMFTSTCKRLQIMKGSEATVKGRGQ